MRCLSLQPARHASPLDSSPDTSPFSSEVAKVSDTAHIAQLKRSTAPSPR